MENIPPPLTEFKVYQDKDDLLHGKWLLRQKRETKINGFECDNDTDQDEIENSRKFMLKDLRQAIEFYQQDPSVSKLLVRNVK